MESLSRRSVIAGAIGVVGAGVAGCAPATPAVTESASPTPSESVDTTPRWPLTGVPLKDGEDPKHIAVAVKVGDNKNEHPQVGINDADIVYVELDGYGGALSLFSGTRLVPVFHSKYAKDVGSVRSMRPVDAPMLCPMTAIIGSTGGAAGVKNYLLKFSDYIVTEFEDIKVPGPSYTYDPKRIRRWPNGKPNLDRATICHPAILAKLTKKFQEGPQQHYLPWAPSEDQVSTVNGKAAASIAVPWLGVAKNSMTYTWDAKKQVYLRSTPWKAQVLSDGTRVTTDNVLVILAKQDVGKFLPHEPMHYIIDASGPFYYAHGGKYVTGKWSKGAVNEAFKFTLDDGTPLKIAPGRTFIELPDLEAKIVIKG